MDVNIAFTALFLGLIAQSSLPLASFTNLFWKPGEKILAFMIALASGALLAATFDLVRSSQEYYWYLALGCVIGSILFISIGRMINNKGGFLRKQSLFVRYLRKKKREQSRIIFEKLSKIELFQQLPPEEIHELVPFITNRTYIKGTTIFHQGEPADSMYIIDEGIVNIVDDKQNIIIATLHTGDPLGEIALCTGETRSASAITESDTKVWVILKEDFDKYLMASPKIVQAVQKIINARIDDLKQKKFIDAAMADKWVNSAIKNLEIEYVVASDADVIEAQEEHKNYGMAIWLGNFFESIPGSIVIGASAASDKTGISLALIIGIFFGGFPEALTGSADMQKQGNKFIKVFSMWTLLFLISGVSSFLGCLAFRGVQHTEGIFTFLEGIVAGAMLTRIADTMLPESYHKDASIIGFSTVFGFLVAIFISRF